MANNVFYYVTVPPMNTGIHTVYKDHTTNYENIFKRVADLSQLECIIYGVPDEIRS